MSEGKEIRLTIFADEEPELFRFVSQLPASRHRRRTALLRALRQGIHPYLASLPTVDEAARIAQVTIGRHDDTRSLPPPVEKKGVPAPDDQDNEITLNIASEFGDDLSDAFPFQQKAN